MWETIKLREKTIAFGGALYALEMYNVCSSGVSAQGLFPSHSEYKKVISLNKKAHDFCNLESISRPPLREVVDLQLTELVSSSVVPLAEGSSGRWHTQQLKTEVLSLPILFCSLGSSTALNSMNPLLSSLFGNIHF